MNRPLTGLNTIFTIAAMLAANLSNLDLWVMDVLNALGFPASELFKVFLAALLGSVAGLEREIRGRQAGFRTYTLVAIGSCLVMVVSIGMAQMRYPVLDGRAIQVDPARIAYGVMTGIGFLGAGSIIHQKSSVRGLTTAAGIWCVAAVGLAVGAGMFSVAGGATILVLLVLWVMHYIERKVPQARHRQLTLRLPGRGGDMTAIEQWMRSQRLFVTESGFERDPSRDETLLTLRIGYRRGHDLRRLEADLAERFPTSDLLASKEV